jgi:hypothetical protein
VNQLDNLALASTPVLIESLSSELASVSPDQKVLDYAAKLKADKSFLNLILVNVATGINQFRLHLTNTRLKKDRADARNLCSETEKLGVLQKQTLLRIERRFRSVLRTDEFPNPA